MLMSVIPGTTQSDAQGALAILQTVSTDKRYKERLQELIEAAATADTALTNLYAAKTDAESKLTAAETMRAAIELEAGQIMEGAKLAAAQAEEARIAVKEREDRLDASIRNHAIENDRVRDEQEAYAKQLEAIAAQHHEEHEKKVVNFRGYVQELDGAIDRFAALQKSMISDQKTIEDLKLKLSGYMD